MPSRTIANVTVDMDDEGFMTNPGAWTKEIAVALAAEDGLELTDRHWTVIEFVRRDFAQTGAAPSLRRITKESGVGTKELYELFPKGPGKRVARIAGLGKPEGCV